MAYVVGLTATDGCLITGRKQINFKSSDRELVALYLALLGRKNKIGSQATTRGRVVFKTQFGDASLYDWLTAVGLTPRKSLTLGALNVPREFIVDTARGLLDGDGSIINKTFRADTKAPRPYFWEYLQAKFYSASRAHLVWLQEQLAATVAVKGWLGLVSKTSAGNDYWTLVYGKHDSITLLREFYQDPAAPCLTRKRAIWLNYVSRHALSASIQ